MSSSSILMSDTPPSTPSIIIYYPELDVQVNETTNETTTKQSPPLDTVVRSVLNKFITRAEFGMQKYGVNLDRTDLSLMDWIQHAQEELMDAILYLEKLKQQQQQQHNNPTHNMTTPPSK